MENQPKNTRLTGKLITLVILVVVSWVATLLIWGVIQDRENRQNNVSKQISEQWSRAQTIAGPVLTVPVEKVSHTPSGEPVINRSTLTILPEELSYDSNIETKLLSRGIYDTPVYTTLVKGTGKFSLSDVEIESLVGTNILWNKAILSINVSDPRGISSLFPVTFDNKQYQMIPSSKFATFSNNGVHVSVPIDPDKFDYKFSFALPLKGSKEISFLPLGEDTEVKLSSGWSSPSFIGEFLPEKRDISSDGFTATWKITSYGKNLPQFWVDNQVGAISGDSLFFKSFGVGLYQEVDFYTMIDRSMKYSILFICLTFLTFFMYELLAGLRIHPMQYLLVGLAIALFYLLLLSLSEIIGFFLAYLFASFAVTVLITGYCSSVLKAKTRAFSIMILLIALYGYLYILLQMDQYSLLFGSVLLFGVLTTVMYITRNLDWYSVGNK